MASVEINQQLKRVEIEDFEIQIAKTYISDLVAFPRSAISSELTDKNARLQMDNLMNEVIEKINN